MAALSSQTFSRLISPSRNSNTCRMRPRDAGVTPEVVSEYVGVDEAALDCVYRIAEAKLCAAEQSPTRSGRTPSASSTIVSR
jgi:hypothetical protein